MKSQRAFSWAVVTGTTLQLFGLALDLWLHGREPSLAAHEGVLTLANPGHALFALGLALNMGGALLAGVDKRQRSSRPTPASAVPIVLLLLAVGSVAAAHWSSVTAQNSSSPHVGSVNVSDDGHNRLGPGHAQGTTIPAKGDQQQHRTEVAITEDQLRALVHELDTARRASEKYRDISVALAEGYIQVTQDLPGLAAHFLNPRLSARSGFDPAKPQILLYTKQHGGWELVGVSYTSAGLTSDGDFSEQPPEGFSGPLDVWHYHENLCFVAGPRVSVADRESCLNRGGIHLARTPWMLHVWLWDDAPEGIFAHADSNLKGSPD